MDRVPKLEPGSSSLPTFASSVVPGKDLKDMSVSELVAVLRPAYRMEDYDRVEEVLEMRYKMLQFERLARIHAEDELKKKEEECDKRKRAQDNYEMLMKTVKEDGLFAAKDSIQELKKKNDELENENCELKEVKKKLVDDFEELRIKNVELQCELKKKNGELENENSELKVMKKKLVDDVEELRIKNVELFAENYKLKEMKENWVDDSNALAELRIRVSVLEEQKLKVQSDLVAIKRKNSELEEAGEKDLATMEELRDKSRKLAEEKRGLEELVESLERKFGELNGRVARLEDDTRILMNADNGGGNIEGDSPAADLRANFGVIHEEDIGDYEFGNDTGGDTVKRNEDTHHSLGGVPAQLSSKGSKDAGDRIAKLRDDVEIIVLDDSDDDDGCTSKRLHGKNALPEITAKNEPQSLSGQAHQKNRPAFELLKRKMSFSDSSPDDELDVDDLPTSSAFNKKSKN